MSNVRYISEFPRGFTYNSLENAKKERELKDSFLSSGPLAYEPPPNLSTNIFYIFSGATSSTARAEAEKMKLIFNEDTREYTAESLWLNSEFPHSALLLHSEQAGTYYEGKVYGVVRIGISGGGLMVYRIDADSGIMEELTDLTDQIVESSTSAFLRCDAKDGKLWYSYGRSLIRHNNLFNLSDFTRFELPLGHSGQIGRRWAISANGTRIIGGSFDYTLTQPNGVSSTGQWSELSNGPAQINSVHLTNDHIYTCTTGLNSRVVKNTHNKDLVWSSQQGDLSFDLVREFPEFVFCFGARDTIGDAYIFDRNTGETIATWIIGTNLISGGSVRDATFLNFKDPLRFPILSAHRGIGTHINDAREQKQISQISSFTSVVDAHAVSAEPFKAWYIR